MFTPTHAILQGMASLVPDATTTPWPPEMRLQWLEALRLTFNTLWWDFDHPVRPERESEQDAPDAQGEEA